MVGEIVMICCYPGCRKEAVDGSVYCEEHLEMINEGFL